MGHNKLIKSMLLLLSFALLSVTAFADKPLSMFQSAKSLQDRSRALQYFQDQLDFTTTPYRVKTALEAKDPRIVILDVRDVKSYQKSRIPGSLNLPLGAYSHFKDRRDLILQLEPGKIYYVYCYHELCNLSQQACQDLIKLGYRAQEIRGGFKGWEALGYPVERCTEDCACQN